MALLLRLAVAMMSSWRQEFPAATAFAVAIVIPLVMRMNSSGVVVFAGGSALLNTCVIKPGWMLVSFPCALIYLPHDRTRGPKSYFM